MRIYAPLLLACALCVYRHDDALRPERARAQRNQVRVADGSGIDGYFVGACVQHGAHVFDGSKSAADGQGNEHLIGGAPHHVMHDAAVFVRGRNIQKNEFVRAFGVVKPGLFDGVAGVHDVYEAHAFDHAAFVHVQTGNDASGQRHQEAGCLSGREVVFAVEKQSRSTSCL